MPFRPTGLKLRCELSTASGSMTVKPLQLIKTIADIQLAPAEMTAPLNFSPDGLTLLFASQDTVQMIDTTTWEAAGSFKNVLEGYTIQEVQISRDLQFVIVSASGYAGACYGSGLSFALYHKEKDGWVKKYEDISCPPYTSHAKFTDNGFAYFFYQYADENHSLSGGCLLARQTVYLRLDQLRYAEQIGPDHLRYLGGWYNLCCGLDQAR